MDRTFVGMEESTGTGKIHRKIYVSESHFNEVSGLETCNVAKK